MGIRLIIISTLVIMLGVSCKGSKTGPKALPNPVAEDHSTGEYGFPAGVYYMFNFKGSPTYDFDLAGAVNQLKQNGFRPAELWYKPGASSCAPPGSELAMTVMVEPVLLMRFKKEQPGIEKIGYELVEEPSAGSCAYVVKRYRF